jgi:hypothetical protein
MPTATPNRSRGKAKSTSSTFKGSDFALPDTLGVASRLAVKRLHEADIALKPLLRRTGLPVTQIGKRDVRIGVASQIKFLELAAETLNDPLLGFRSARDGDLRELGPFYYIAASSETIGDALYCAERYISLANAGVALKCLKAGKFMIALHYIGVARHSDRQQMEALVTGLIRVCRVLAGRHLSPKDVHFVHRRLGKSSELEKFFGCPIKFNAEID